MAKPKISGKVIIDGMAKLEIEIDKLSKIASSKIRDEIIMSAHEIRNDIILSMRNTPKTGNVYRRGGKEHIASSPGNPPAKDTGELIRSIVVDNAGDTIEVGVTSGAPYGKYLERGTDKMKARPFLQPALDKNLPGIKSRILALIK
jgi:HK97 gp10 family phage protein